MDNQNERLGSLMIFSDIALILSTYGVLFAFNYFVTPISTNMWIVCTFFVGIKILIVGIADVTGIGRNPFVSVVFVLIADVIIVLINMLMAFGISLRMLLIMTIVDVCLLLVASFLWRAFIYKRGESKAEEAGDWFDSHEEVQNDSAAQTVKAQKPVTESATSTEKESIPGTGTEVFSFDEILEDNDLEKAGLSADEQPKSEEDFLTFEELTDSLDTEEVKAETEAQKPAQTEGQAVEEPEPEITFYTEAEETFEEEPEQVFEFETEEESFEPEPVIDITRIENLFKENAEETQPETVAESVEEAETSANPLPLIDAAVFKEFTGQPLDADFTFEELTDEAEEEEIAAAREQLIADQLNLSGLLNILIDVYNQSDDAVADDDRIEITHNVSNQSSFKTNDNILKSELKEIIAREFLEEEVAETLAVRINRLNSRNSQIQAARQHLRDREEMEKRRREEIEKQEAQLRRRREEARRQAQERKRREQIAAFPEVRLKDNEVRLNSDGIDIIILRDDLELLREYLQESNQI